MNLWCGEFVNAGEEGGFGGWKMYGKCIYMYIMLHVECGAIQVGFCRVRGSKLDFGESICNWCSKSFLWGAQSIIEQYTRRWVWLYMQWNWCRVGKLSACMHAYREEEIKWVRELSYSNFPLFETSACFGTSRETHLRWRPAYDESICVSVWVRFLIYKQ